MSDPSTGITGGVDPSQFEDLDDTPTQSFSRVIQEPVTIEGTAEAVSNTPEAHANTQPDSGPVINHFGGGEPLGLISDRQDMPSKGKLDEVLDDHLASITAGMDAKLRVLTEEEAQLLQQNPELAGAQSGPGGGRATLGAALVAGIGNMLRSGSRAKLHEIQRQQLELRTSRDEVLRVHAVFAAEIKSYSAATTDLNAMIYDKPEIRDFHAAVVGLKNQTHQSLAFTYARLDDPLDKDPVLQPIRNLAESLRLDPTFAGTAADVGRHAITAETAAGVLKDLLNNENLMGAADLKAVEITSKHLADQIVTTDFPVAGAKVHPSNSALKASISDIADLARRLAEHISAMINHLFAVKSEALSEPSLGT